ncbi:uncharacterized protein LOC113147580, partial [Cyclospora cayetanensis]|uniref:Uncharacterized protein LOC113147580 n=1 Tax=Cyclospora cayetanensis TaxID=88456 RepID=A0A6P6S2J5_9EIME
KQQQQELRQQQQRKQQLEADRWSDDEAQTATSSSSGDGSSSSSSSGALQKEHLKEPEYAHVTGGLTPDEMLQEAATAATAATAAAAAATAAGPAASAGAEAGKACGRHTAHPPHFLARKYSIHGRKLTATTQHTMRIGLLSPSAPLALEPDGSQPSHEAPGEDAASLAECPGGVEDSTLH